MTAIETCFLGPTNYRGSRYKATALGTGQTVTLEADHALDYPDNHIRVARALIEKMSWLPQLNGGSGYGSWYMADAGKRGYVFVCALEYACAVKAETGSEVRA